MSAEQIVKIKVGLDAQKIPERISWQAANQPEWQEVKAMLLSLWDAKESSALRLDLWVKDMPVDSMGDFLFQTLSALSETYTRAVPDSELGREIKDFARQFFQKFLAERQKKSNSQ